MDEAGDRQRHAESIEGEGQREVLVRLRIRAAPDLVGVHHRAQEVAHDHDIRRFNRDVRPGTDGDPHDPATLPEEWRGTASLLHG